MNKTLTELIFILDRSGSMHPLESDTIGGYNGFLERQKAEEGQAIVTTVLFDDRYELLHDHVDIQRVAPITEKEYYARGSTALLDAIGKTISDVEHRQHFSDEADTPAKTMVVIITDGLENSSHEYSLEQVKKMIQTQQEKHGWEFIFMGANMDAVKVAGGMGIAANRAVNYHADSQGTALNFYSVTAAASMLRQSPSGTIDESWREAIDEDYEKRK